MQEEKTIPETAVGDSVQSQQHSIVEDIAEHLAVKLPKQNLPLPMRIIMLVFVIGGLSILTSIFTDFVASDSSLVLYIYRLMTGAAFLLIAYGLYERRRWSVWLYGLLVFVGLIINFFLALAPALLVAYLYTQRHLLAPSFMDRLAGEFILQAKEKYKIISQ